MSDRTKEFAKAVAIRAVRTFAQAAVASIGSAVAMGDVNWAMVGSTAVLASVVSVLMSIGAGLPEVEPKL